MRRKDQTPQSLADNSTTDAGSRKGHSHIVQRSCEQKQEASNSTTDHNLANNIRNLKRGYQELSLIRRRNQNAMMLHRQVCLSMEQSFC